MLSSVISKQVSSKTRHCRFGLWSFIWRGAVGGATIPLIRGVYNMYQVPYMRLFLLAFLMLLLIPAAFGALIGTLLWLIVRKFGKLGVISRAALGMAIGAVFSFPYIYFAEHSGDSGAGFNSLGNLFQYAILTGLVIGLPVGVLVPASDANQEKDS